MAVTFRVTIFAQRKADGERLAELLYPFTDPADVALISGTSRLTEHEKSPFAADGLMIYIVKTKRQMQFIADHILGVTRAGSPQNIVIAAASVIEATAALLGDTALIYLFPKTEIDWKYLAPQIQLSVQNARRFLELRNASSDSPRETDEAERESVLHSLGFFACALISDFNNTLRLTSKHLQVLKKQFDPANPLFEEILGLDAAARYTRGLTEKLCRLCAGEKEPSALFDLNHALKEVAFFVQRTLQQRVTFTFELHPGPLKMYGAEIQIQRAIFNLIINAVEAMPEGGVLKARSGFMPASFTDTLRIQAPAGAVWVAILDRGMGMTPAQKERIFHPFFTSKRDADHLGLGLTTIREIVSAHNGTLSVETQAGRGATFTLYFPALTKQQQAMLQKNNERTAGKTVLLLVEPEPLVQSMTRSLLESGGYRVVTAATAREAVDLYFEHRHEVNLILLDTVLPDAPLQDTIKNLTSINPEIPILLSSGNVSRSGLEEALPGQVTDFIQKPYRMMQLYQKIENMLESPGVLTPI